MVLQQSINKLKEGPDEHKQMAAIGGAGLVVLLLIVAWGYIFIKRIQNERFITPADVYQAEQTQAPNSAARLNTDILTPRLSPTTEFGQSVGESAPLQ